MTVGGTGGYLMRALTSRTCRGSSTQPQHPKTAHCVPMFPAGLNWCAAPIIGTAG